ncbi:ABC transporter permease [Bradyrhizobium sp. Gha]|uniref:ABC transporter permease n=1 Tax=Bradyrhizobium sp. Gha TaxID=1855318 RepID=UPI0008F06B93|nr:ABC transporter permease [Bradyrhizobium sp. Gha]SFK16660.1 peptide/nickel transport system permease protein [Bradyrhizobium sp. Gha]
MLALVLRKLFRAALTVWLTVSFVFIVLRLSGDPAQIILPINLVTPEVEAALRHKWGLDQPLIVQYLDYVANVFRGDFGFSFRDGRPAVSLVLASLPNTLALMVVAVPLTICTGIAIGVLAALRRGRLTDRAIMLTAVTAFSVPNFFLGILTIIVFAVSLHWLPTGGTGSIRHVVLPVLCLSAAWIGIFARFTRGATIDVLGQPFVTGLRGRGIPQMAIIRAHILPNGMIPTLTVFGMYIGSLISGSIIVESLFAWPGVGHLLVESVFSRDLAVVQAIILLASLMMVTANLLVDLSYGWLDPRIRDLEIASRVL